MKAQQELELLGQPLHLVLDLLAVLELLVHHELGSHPILDVLVHERHLLAVQRQGQLEHQREVLGQGLGLDADRLQRLAELGQELGAPALLVLAPSAEELEFALASPEVALDDVTMASASVLGEELARVRPLLDVFRGAGSHVARDHLEGLLGEASAVASRPLVDGSNRVCRLAWKTS